MGKAASKLKTKTKSKSNLTWSRFGSLISLKSKNRASIILGENGRLKRKHLDIEPWLKALDLEQYVDNFNDYQGVEDLIDCTEADIKALGVRISSHRASIMSSLAALRSKYHGNTTNNIGAFKRQPSIRHSVAVDSHKKIIQEDVMARKYCADDSLYKYLRDGPELQETINIKDESSGSDEEEMIEYPKIESDDEYESELILTSDLDNINYDEYYIGKDKITKWYKTPRIVKCNTNVTVNPGPTSVVMNEIAAFGALINTNMIDDIVNCTNLCINMVRANGQYKRDRDIKETTRSEVMALFGLLFLIGLKKDNHTNVFELWNNDGTGMQVLRSLMSSKRFLFLLTYLSFDDKNSRQDRKKIDKLAPIRSFLTSFVNNCTNSYNLGEFVTIGEKLQAFRGKCGFVQYMPNRAARYGIKLIALCDSKTFFTGNLEVYCGKQPNSNDTINRLVEGIENTNRNLTINYNSYEMAKSLLDKNITCIGGMKKSNLEIPVEFYKKSLFGYQDDMTLVSYNNNNSVDIVLSTMHYTGSIDANLNQPDIILDYNASKNAVDIIDEMCGQYSVARKTGRWPMVVFFSLLDIAGINAQVLYYSNSDNPRIGRKVFLKTLAMSLMRPQLVERAKIHSLPVDIAGFLAKYRSQEIQNEEERNSSKKRGRCVICGRSKNISTTIKCELCKMFTCKKHSIIKPKCIRCVNGEDC